MVEIRKNKYPSVIIKLILNVLCNALITVKALYRTVTRFFEGGNTDRFIQCSVRLGLIKLEHSRSRKQNDVALGELSAGSSYQPVFVRS